MALKRTRLERRTRLSSGKPPERGQPVKRKAKKRQTWERAYGSKDRVVVMKLRPCDGCGRVAAPTWPNECHHVEGDGGMGLKSSWRFTVTLCERCHTLWHALGSSAAFLRETGKDLVAVARRLAVEIPSEGGTT